MNRLELVLELLSIAFQIVLCGFVFGRKVHRVLPFFANYVAILLISSLGVALVYAYFEFGSAVSYYAFWCSAYLYAVAWSLAVAELCRYELRRYPGVWALVWRALAALAVILLARATMDARGHTDTIAIFGAIVLRDVAFSSIAILVALLLLRNYYGLVLDRLQRLVVAGMCLTCGVDAIGYTMFRNFLTGHLYSWFLASQKPQWPALAPQVRAVDDIWSAVHLIAFMFAMGIWCYAFRKPLPEPFDNPVLLSAEAALAMSAGVNESLATFNDRLLDLLKP